MTSLNSTYRALGLCFTVALLAGCAGSPSDVSTERSVQALLPQSAAAVVRAPQTLPTSEVLTASYLQITHSGASCKDSGPSSSWTNSFITYGNASGPMPAAYKGSGQWTVARSKSVETWNFSESITLRSGTTFVTILVSAGSPDPAPPFTCHPKSFGPAVAKYTIQGGGSGKVRIKSLKVNDLNEAFLHFNP